MDNQQLTEVKRIIYKYLPESINKSIRLERCTYNGKTLNFVVYLCDIQQRNRFSIYYFLTTSMSKSLYNELAYILISESKKKTTKSQRVDMIILTTTFILDILDLI